MFSSLWCLTICDSMICSLPGSSVPEISQARIQEWVAISISRGSSRPRDQTQVSCLAGGFFTTKPLRKPKIASLMAQRINHLPAMQETQVQSLGWENSLRKKWPPTPLFLPGESHGQRNLVDYSPRGCKESDITEQLGTY